ncbi:MAG TPA: glycosyltransferase family 2 protein [Polyangiaceae bacterium]
MATRSEAGKRVAVIPALNEEDAIAAVVRGIAAHVDAVVVVDNGSRDDTAVRAREAGAEVVAEPRRGYGAACLAGVERARALGAGVILYLDGDGSDDPADAPRLLGPVERGDAELVLGVRRPADRATMAPVQRFGNWLAPMLMRRLLGARYRDMPPFKAVSADALDRLALDDAGMGYIIQMLLRAHALGLHVVEVEVGCRPRLAGVSKVSGTLVGTVRASAKILWSIGRHALRGRKTSGP